MEQNEIKWNGMDRLAHSLNVLYSTVLSSIEPICLGTTKERQQEQHIFDTGSSHLAASVACSVARCSLRCGALRRLSLASRAAGGGGGGGGPLAVISWRLRHLKSAIISNSHLLVFRTHTCC